MRPKHLTIEGIASFRDSTEIDFRETELLALTGPTGSGKSSILDAMIFALYGRIPRLGDRSVKEAVSEGMRQSEVVLEFFANDQLYRVTRKLRLNKDGDIQRNTGSLERARNNSDDEWEAEISENTKELDKKISEVIGLSSDQFKTCVTVPQGEFAAFLDARPADRQKLIKDLIGVQVYDKIRELASNRSKDLEFDLHTTNNSLNELTDVTKNSVQKAKSHLDGLIELQKTTRIEIKTQSSLTAKMQENQKKVELLDELLTTLKNMKVPAETKKLSKEVDKAMNEQKTATEAQRTAQQRAEKAGKQLEKLGNKAKFEIGLRDLQELSELEREIEKFEKKLELATSETEEAKEHVSAAEQQLNHEQEQLQIAERSDLASKFRVGLKTGEHCPVCDQVVSHLPEQHQHAQLSECESRVAEAKTALKTAETKHKKKHSVHTALDAQQKQRKNQLKKLARSVKDLPKPDTIEKTLKRISATEKERDDAQAEVGKHTRSIQDSESRLQELQEKVSEAWNEFESARTVCSVRNPPPREENDIEASWSKLYKWAKNESATVQAEQLTCIEAEEDLKQQLDSLVDALEREFEEHDVEFDEEDPGSVLAIEIGKTKTLHEEETKKFKQKNSLKRKKTSVERKQKVASALQTHLRSANFERWLLNGVFDTLAVEASTQLNEMSSNQYSLETDDNFGLNIIDHANADAPRSIKTLSGGETFMASLALALSLSANIAGMSSNSGVSLESLFLDEGFGTLDDESLDVVASAIEEMGSKGRMVGIVTHIEKLAERMPVRLKVKKEANASVVERVTA